MTPDFITSGEQYLERYGKLKPMANTGLKSDLNRVFADGPSSHNACLVTRTPVQFQPGAYSQDAAFLNFMKKFVTKLDSEFSVDLDENKFSKNGMYTDFRRLLTVAGFMPDAMSYVPLDNTAYRKELGLQVKMTPEQRQIAYNTWDIICSRIATANIKLPKKSAGGARRTTKDSTWKMDFALFLFESDRFDKMLGWVEKGDWLSLANELETVYMMYMQKRLQVDTPGKDRWAFDLEHVLTDGKSGRYFKVNKDVVINGKLWEGFSATRARVVHAGPWVINCFLQIISTCTMTSMFQRFPDVFHVNTPEEIKRLIDGSYVTCSDVKEYDRSMGKEDMEVIFDVMSKYWSPGFVKAARTLYFSPYYAKPLTWGSTEGGCFVKDPRKSFELDQVVCGNRSGHAWTSLVAKVNKVCETLMIFHAMGLPVIGNEMNYLLAKTPICFINNGDDEVVYTKSAELMKKFKQFRYSGNHGRYSVSEEDGQGFSGLLLILIDPVNLIYQPTAKVHTSFEKMYCPERSIGGDIRPYWMVGFMERLLRANVSDFSKKVWDIFLSTYREHMARHYGDFTTMVYNAMDSLNDIGVEGYSRIDLEVLDEPDKLYYKYLESDVSKEVFEKVTSKIEFKYFEHIVDRHYTGVVDDEKLLRKDPRDLLVTEVSKRSIEKVFS